MNPFVWHLFIRGEKTCLVFLHGLTGSSSAWNDIYPYFQKKGHSILLIDMRGHGLSDKPKDEKDYSLYKIADDVKEIMEQHGIKKAIFIGHCYGAMAILALYEKNPELVEKMVLISTNYAFSTNKMRFLLSRMLYFTYWVLSIFTWPFHLEKNKTHLNYDPFKGSHDFDLRRIFHDLRVTSFTPVLALHKEGASLNFTKTLDKIRVPTLIIHGKKDLVFPLQVSTKMHALIKESKLVQLDTNHMSVLNMPEKIKEEIAKFI